MIMKKEQKKWLILILIVIIIGFMIFSFNLNTNKQELSNLKEKVIEERCDAFSWCCNWVIKRCCADPPIAPPCPKPR
jgi:hypothetical protein